VLPTKDDILVIIPVYNEATHIESLVGLIKGQGFKQICIINDGSTDNIEEILFEAPTIMLHHIINRGVGAATDTGFRYAILNKFNAVITIDADMQHDVKDLDVLFDSYLESNADVIIGSRFLKLDNKIPKIRHLYNKIANLLVFAFSNRWISDTQSGYKFITKKALENIQLKTDGYEFCSEFIIKALQQNFKIQEVPIHVYYTDYSMKKGQSLVNGYRTMISLFSNIFFKD